MADVARRADVSIKTVSRVVNGEAGVSPTTAARGVREIIDDLGFQRHAGATMLRTGRSDRIGLVVEDLANPFYAQLAAGIEREARLRQHLLISTSSQQSAENEAELVDALVAQRVAGPRRGPDRDRAVRGPARRRPLGAGRLRRPAPAGPRRRHGAQRQRGRDAQRRGAPGRPPARADRLPRRRPVDLDRPPAQGRLRLRGGLPGPPRAAALPGRPLRRRRGRRAAAGVDRRAGPGHRRSSPATTG